MTIPDLPLYHLVERSHTGDHLPLIMLLHGYGSNEQDLVDLVPYFGRPVVALSVRAPLVLGPGSFAWFEIGFTPSGLAVDERQAERSLALLVSFIEQARNTYAPNAQPVIIIGFSQGATMAALVGLTRPDLVAGTAILSGIVPSAILREPIDAAALAGQHFFVAHGTQDTVVAVTHGHATRALLREAAADLHYYEYPIGHSISLELLNDLARWLSEIVGA